MRRDPLSLLPTVRALQPIDPEGPPARIPEAMPQLLAVAQIPIL